MSVFTYKEILGILIGIIYIPQIFIYIRSILKGETKPHIYTNLIWTIIMGIGFLIQLNNGGGPGTWYLGTTFIFQLLTLFLAFKYGTTNITKFDTSLLILALFCIAIYIGTQNEFYSLILIIIIDGLGFIPTFRKTYYEPYSENLTAWNMGTFRGILGIAALLEYNIYTMGYVSAIVIFNILFIVTIYYRRVLLK